MKSRHKLVYAFVGGMSMLMLCALSPLAGGAALDYSFGNNGVVSAPVSGNVDAIAVTRSGKLIIGDRYLAQVILQPFAEPALFYDHVVIGLTANGAVDPTFAASGVHLGITQNALGGGVAALLEQPDGKILVQSDDYSVSGTLEGGGLRARFLSDGTLDSAFNAQWASSTPGVDRLAPTRLILQPDGKVISITDQEFVSPTDQHDALIVVRANSDGTLDPTFAAGNVGTAVSGTTGFFDLKDAILDSEGKIVIAASNWLSPFQKAGVISLLKLNGDGTPDATFGAGGWRSYRSDANPYIEPSLLGIQPDGSLVVAATSCKQVVTGNNACPAGLSQTELRSFSPAGSLNTSFGQNGVVIAKQPASLTPRMLIRPDGSILLGTQEGTVLGFTPTGQADSSFGTNGVLVTPLNVLSDMALDLDGNLYVAGANLSGQPAVARFTGLSCDISLNPTSAVLQQGPQHASITVTASASCAWTASTDVDWIYFDNASGSGTGAVEYHVFSNFNRIRSGTITIGSQLYTVQQCALIGMFLFVCP